MENDNFKKTFNLIVLTSHNVWEQLFSSLGKTLETCVPTTYKKRVPLYVCVYVCVYIVCMCMCVCMYACVSVYICMYILCTCVVYVYICVCMYASAYVCLCMYVCIYVYTVYVRVYMCVFV